MVSSSQNVQPTRGELLRLKKRIALAERGHELLEEKRDALVTEFFDSIDLLRERKEKTEKMLKSALDEITEAQIVMGTIETERAADSTTHETEVDVGSRNIMGVEVPVIESQAVKKDLIDRGYSIQQTSSKLDEAAEKFEEALESILELAETEETVKKMAGEIEKTKRRVNSLEHVLIPRLKENEEYIEMRLEEQDRENYFRLKRVKERMR
ncbi:MAG: V-type ATP synthase subunit D [Candidatus Hadarchaeia archaeon]